MQKDFIKEKIFKLGGEKLFSLLVNIINKDIESGDDIVLASFALKRDNDPINKKLFSLSADLGIECFFDEFNFKCADYEKNRDILSANDRISALKDLLEYSMVEEYAAELAILYFESGQKQKAKRLLVSAKSVIDSFDFADIMLLDISNNTHEYKKLVNSYKTSSIIHYSQCEPESNSSNVNEYTNDINVSTEHELSFEKEDNCEDNNENQEYPEIITEAFEGLVGMISVKEQIYQIYNKIRVEKIRNEKLGIDSSDKERMNFVIYGNPGTGKTTVARIIGEILYRLGLLNSNEVVETDRSGLVSEHIGGTEAKTKEVIESARGCTLFIDEAYSLYRENSQNDFGKEAIDTLLKDVEDHGGEYCIILAGYKEEMMNMMKKANKGFASRFNYQIEIPNYTNEELYEILTILAQKKHYELAPDVKEVVFDRIKRENVDETFDNARFIRRLFDSAVGKNADRLSKKSSLTKSDLVVLPSDCFKLGDETKDKDLKYYMNQLDSLIGLSNVKAQIKEIVAVTLANDARRKRNLSVKDNSVITHMAFVGNPGTGKTTVARIVANIFAQLGVIKRPDRFVEVTRSDLVGRYQGETAIKTKDVINSALGGVLFIDEVYDLKNDPHDSFGQEAINTLVSQMENMRDSLLVIIAGYTKETKEFLDTNSGLQSRIPTFVEFEDYSLDEMVKILLFTIDRQGYKISSIIDKDYIRAFIEIFSKAKNFGNARGIRNICNELILKQNVRISSCIDELSDEELLTITEDDFNKVKGN